MRRRRRRRRVLRVRELGACDRVPHAIGQHGALAQEQPGRWRDRIAGARPLGCHRLLDRPGHGLGATSKPRQRTFVGIDGGGRHRLVELRVRTVPVNLADGGPRGLRELGLDQTGFDHDDVDAEALHLEPQRIADRLDCMLGCVVGTSARERQLAAHRAEVHDPARALPAHARQDQLAHADQPEHVRLELPPHVIEVERLDRTRLAVAGVVDKHSDGALCLLDGGHGRAHRLLVGHIERERAAATVGQIRDRLEPARRRVHPVATRRHELRRGTADARRASGDQNCLRLHRHLQAFPRGRGQA